MVETCYEPVVLFSIKLTNFIKTLCRTFGKTKTSMEKEWGHNTSGPEEVDLEGIKEGCQVPTRTHGLLAACTGKWSPGKFRTQEQLDKTEAAGSSKQHTSLYLLIFNVAATYQAAGNMG